MGSFLSHIITTFSAFLYPLYASYKAVKTNDGPESEAWLMYWVVMGFVSLAEMTVEWLVNWFPFYYEVKTLVILWIALPQIRGSTFIYMQIIHPLLERHEQEIDKTIADTKQRAKAAGVEYIRKGVMYARDAAFKILAGEALAGAAGGQGAGGQAGQNDQIPEPQDPTNPNLLLSPNTLSNLIRDYGPALGNALFHPAAAYSGRGRFVPRGQQQTNHASEAPGDQLKARKAAELRRQLEELEGYNVGNDQDRIVELGDDPPPGAASSPATSLFGPPPGSRLSAGGGGGVGAKAGWSRPNSVYSLHDRGSSASAASSGRSVSSQDTMVAYSRSRTASRASYGGSGYPTTSSSHPSSPIMNNTPRDPVAARIDQSFADGGLGFEDITREDAVGDGNGGSGDKGQKPPLQTASYLSGWWFWGGTGTGSSATPTTPIREKKD